MFKLSSTVKDSKKELLKHVTSKRGIRDQSTLDKVRHLTNRDMDKAEIFNGFFTSVINITDGLWYPQSSVL